MAAEKESEPVKADAVPSSTPAAPPAAEEAPDPDEDDLDDLDGECAGGRSLVILRSILCSAIYMPVIGSLMAQRPPESREGILDNDPLDILLTPYRGSRRILGAGKTSCGCTLVQRTGASSIFFDESTRTRCRFRRPVAEGNGEAHGRC